MSACFQAIAVFPAHLREVVNERLASEGFPRPNRSGVCGDGYSVQLHTGRDEGRAREHARAFVGWGLATRVLVRTVITSYEDEELPT